MAWKQQIISGPEQVISATGWRGVGPTAHDIVVLAAASFSEFLLP